MEIIFSASEQLAQLDEERKSQSKLLKEKESQLNGQ